MRIIKSALISAALLATTAFAVPAYATGFPVFDGSNFATQLQEGLRWIDEMQARGFDLTELRAQTLGQIQEIEAMTGVTDFGTLLNGAAEFELRNHIPVSFNDLQSIEGDGTLVGTYAEEYRDYYNPPTALELYGPDDVGSDNAMRYDAEVDFTLTTLAASKSSYEVAGDRMATMETMLIEIDQTLDVKESTDLQSRILLENMAIQNELLRVQALTLQMQMQDKASQLAVLQAEQEFTSGGLDGVTNE